MSDTYTVVMGEKGRVVVPAELREHRGWTRGTTLIAVEERGGVVLMERETLLRRIRDELDGESLVESLLSDRRRAAKAEDSA